MKLLVAGACALLLAVAPMSGSAALAQTAKPPAAAFARLPAVQQAEISPNGQKIAILGGDLQQRTLSINPIDGQNAVVIPLGAVDVKEIRWTGDQYLVATVRIFDSNTDFADGRTYSYNLQRDIVFDMKGQIVGLLLDGTSWAGFATNRPILGVVEGDKPAVMMLGIDMGSAAGDSFSRIKQKGAGFVAALYKVDVASGSGRLTERGNGGTFYYDVDRAGEARVRLDADLGQTSLYARRKGASGWTLIDKSPSMALKIAYLGYSDPEDAIYLKQETSTGVRIIRQSLADGARTDIGPAEAAPDAGLIWDPHTFVPVAIVSGGGERPVYQWLDPQLGAVHAKLSRGLKGRNVQFMSWSADRGRIILKADAPGIAPAWYLFEPQTNQASPIGEAYPELAEVAGGRSQWLTFKARDGLAMWAYLTVPTNLAPGVKAPLIVMPHGGPAARDRFAFDWWEQFLVSRGYAVLKPQFRGSAGFGADFERAGFNEWGGKMQSDLTDAVDAVADPAVDTSRLCIVGASYGGFAALSGATARPERYSCAISVNGVSDLAGMLGHARVYSGGDSEVLRYWREVIGDSRVTAKQINAASPARQVGGGTAPILLVYAAHDTTVPNTQSQLMDSALTAAGAPHQVVVLDGDDHYLSSAKSRLQLLEATDAFLARYLPVGP